MGLPTAQDLSEFKIAELDALAKDLAVARGIIMDRTRAKAIAEIEEIARKYDLPLDQLVGQASLREGGASTLKARPRFRHPEDPTLTWSGRGRQPLWLKSLLATGVRVESLRIRD